MAREIIVHLSSNVGYWQADWKDVLGRRRKKSLGSESVLSKRQARKACQELSNALNRHPGRTNSNAAPVLSDFVDRYILSRTDLGDSSRYLYMLTGRYLAEFFGAGTRIDRITRSAARDWRSALQAGQFSKGRVMSETSACDYCKYAKSMFNQAVEDDVIPFNPFDKLRSSAPDPEKNWHYVSIADFEALLVACPDDGWRVLIALCRLAGLRRGEAASLPWTAVDWERRRLTVFATKTAKSSESGGKRIVPIEPRLYELLLKARVVGEPDSQKICNVSSNNLRRDFAVIRKRAGLVAWAEPFQVMRRNRETDWAKLYPQHAVSEWMGHDITVSARFYLTVTEDLYNKVAGPEPPVVPQNLPQTGQ